MLTSGEPPFEVNPADHHVALRAAQAARDGVGNVVIGLSSPLGIEYLMPEDAVPLLDAYHDGSPLLDVLAERDLPLFIHPGPAAGANAAGPAWWAALVPYVQQLHAAWFAFRAYGRPAYPRLRVCFTALAGLGPLHGERLAARGGADPLARGAVDPRMFVETSSYGNRAVDSVLRVLGVDMLVFGSDRPYAQPHPDSGLGDAARHAIRATNPARLLHGDRQPSHAGSDRPAGEE